MNSTLTLVLAETELRTLKIWALLQASPRLTLRAEIVLTASTGLLNAEIAEALRLSERIVARWRQRFQNARLAGMEKEAPRDRIGLHIFKKRFVIYSKQRTRALQDPLMVNSRPCTMYRLSGRPPLVFPGAE